MSGVVCGGEGGGGGNGAAWEGGGGRARPGVDLLEHLVDVGVEGLSALALLGLLATARALRGLCGLLAGCCLCHLGLLKGFGLHPAPKKKFGVKIQKNGFLKNGGGRVYEVKGKVFSSQGKYYATNFAV